MWVNRSARYPYTSESAWWTRAHLLRRKVQRQGYLTTNDRRTAAILFESAQRTFSPSSPRQSEATELLSMIVDG